MTLGPVMLDLVGLELSAEEREMLRHPRVGGVILFSRNYASPAQLQQLVDEIHALREPRLLVAVDHEGGRVQRFRHAFTALPPARSYGRVYDRDRRRGRHLAELGGWLMASELRAVGVDFSFAPVLDLDYGVSEVIGDRAFHRDAEAVGDLAQAYMAGMKRAGMAATGKHFPGHGAVAPDSHIDLPVDERPLVDIEADDLRPFERLIHAGLAGVMPAHVVYAAVDPRPAGFSAHWLKDILRGRLDFQGVIFSDDLSMRGAHVMGDIVARGEAALAAGCDMVLVCNHPQDAARLLDGLDEHDDPVSHLRLARLHARHPLPREALLASDEWRQAVAALQPLHDHETLELEV